MSTSWIRHVFVIITMTYLLYGAGLYLLQDAMIFPRPGGIERSDLDLSAREFGADPILLTATDGVELYAWHKSAGHGRAVLYFPGNGEVISSNVGLYRLLNQAGWDVFAIAYRGYPGSEGRPSQAGLAMDAQAAWDQLTGPLGIPPDHIVLHGRSLGGGVAVELASHTNPAAMVLESTFFSLLELAQRRAPLLPTRLLLWHPFESWRLAPKAGVPVLQLHSADDDLIPVDQARRLHARFAEATYLESRGYPHNIPLAVADPASRQAYLKFLKEAVP